MRRSFVQRPGYYENSEAKFKAIQLVLALKEDYGVGYDPGRIGRAGNQSGTVRSGVLPRCLRDLPVRAAG